MHDTAFDREWEETRSARKGGLGASFGPALKEAGMAAIDSEVSLRCAGVAFYAFLSIFPALAAGVIIFGLVLEPSMVGTILSQGEALLPGSVMELLRTQLDRLMSGDSASLGVGLLIALAIALWSGSRGINALTFALTKANGTEQKRGFLANAMISLGLTLGAFLLGGLILTSLTVLPLAFAWLPFPSIAETLSLILRWPIMAAILVMATLVLYRVGPEGKPQRFSRIWPGAVIATLLWLGATFLFSIYVENFGSYDATFGALSAAVILMLWMYYSSVIFVAGQVFNRALFKAE